MSESEFNVITVGEASTLPPLLRDGSVLMYPSDPGIPNFLVCRMTRPTRSEVEDFHRGGWWFRLVGSNDPADPVTIIAKTKGGAIFEATYHAGLASADVLAMHEESRAQLRKDPNLRHTLNAVLVDEHNVVMAMAFMTLSPRFSREWEKAVAAQAGHEFDREDYVRRLAAQPSVRALWAKGSRIYCKAGES